MDANELTAFLGFITSRNSKLVRDHLLVLGQVRMIHSPIHSLLETDLTRPALGLGAMDNQYQNQHFGPMRNYGESRGTTAFPAPSLSPSPPRNMVLTEQRELKRLHDAARRNSKNRMRRETSENASSYTTSIVNTPEMIPGSLVSYTSSIPPLSLAAEVSSNVLPQGYIAPYQASYPQSMRSNSGHEIFNSGFSMYG